MPHRDLRFTHDYVEDAPPAVPIQGAVSGKAGGPVTDHSHTASGDGGTFDAANLRSDEDAEDGAVPSADGAGGVEWRTLTLDSLADVNAPDPNDGDVPTWDDSAGEWVASPPAGGTVDAADVTYTPTTAADWESDADPGDVDNALDQLAERVDDLEGAAPGSGDVTWAVIQASQLANEVKGFPSLVGIDIDLDAANQWWDKVGTPTTAVTMVDLAGEAGITETWEYALATVCDDASEGFYQRFTYADEPRVKAGRKLSAIAAVWVGTAGTTVTMKLVTSEATEVSATATAQAWTVVTCESLTLDGTYVDLQFTTDTADTFYVVPLGVNIGEKAVPLRPRELAYRHLMTPVLLLNLAGKGDEATWTDIDATANSGPLAGLLNLSTVVYESGSDAFWLYLRVHGSAAGNNRQTAVAQAWSGMRLTYNHVVMGCDDGQIFEYYLDRTSGFYTLDDGHIDLLGWWEWE